MSNFEWGFGRLLGELTPEHKSLLQKFSRIKGKDPSVSLLLDYLTVTEEEKQVKEADVLFIKGNKLAIGGQYEEAIECYKKAVDIKEDSHEAWNNMGTAYSDLGQYKEAIENYKKAVDIKKDSHEAWYNMGNAYSKLGQYEEAIESYKKAVDIKKDKHEAWYNMGTAYREIEDIKNALTSHQEAVKYLSDDSLYWYQLAVDWQMEGNVNETAKSLKVCFALKPEFREIFKSDERFNMKREEVEKIISSQQTKS
ncbi:MAG: tetratricopeptide repeat protein [Nitrospinae bacterium]|nr:tetratricopeptide repeat protein [Nitrospinota bacterium]